ncbi:uroporphyrinogen-III synthase [Flavobacterium rakeshii]|uniref:Uroporphyrinogen-III synthase n=1 Tax=Flavobacterium rakeshii TaxID=1038845 RepID=A0A6N8HHZ6_9FLAO|nr:uroporphyrinogen-III synthase [Flavobacterium rakeshii]MEE1897361.1 uroporphyrinogen-III synthase [Flavobacterium rakeshii]MUV05311.1 uroporphyrinogen-III synthase [Flavobacterium rakeshii]
MEGGIRILSTKKLQGNHRQYLLNAGLSVLEADFITTVNKPFELGDIPHNLIFTSQNAFKSFLLNGGSTQYKGSSIFCVGTKTAELVKQHGYRVEVCADYAKDLSQIILQQYKEREFVFFSGNLRQDTLPLALKGAGIRLTEIQAYETALTPHKINAELNGVLFFSPSGIESFLQENEISNTVCFCIGTTTAKALQGITENIVVANHPSVENVIIQCINYYKDNPARF